MPVDIGESDLSEVQHVNCSAAYILYQRNIGIVSNLKEFPYFVKM